MLLCIVIPSSAVFYPKIFLSIISCDDSNLGLDINYNILLQHGNITEFLCDDSYIYFYWNLHNVVQILKIRIISYEYSIDRPIFRQPFYIMFAIHKTLFLTITRPYHHSLLNTTFKTLWLKFGWNFSCSPPAPLLHFLSFLSFFFLTWEFNHFSSWQQISMLTKFF